VEWSEGLIHSTPLESWRNPLHWSNPLESSGIAGQQKNDDHRSNPRILFTLFRCGVRLASS
jgi:hypothetical protein